MKDTEKKKNKSKLKLIDGEPCLNKGKLTVKCSQCLSSNLNKHCESHSPATSLNKSHSAASAETYIFFLFASGISSQKLSKMKYQNFLIKSC